MIYWQTVHTETRDGFDIVLSITPEDMPPDWDVTEDELRKIEDGTLAYFIARVEARRDGITLGTDYLGGCCYESTRDFIDESGYYADMVARSIDEARATLARLTQPA